MIPKIIHQIWVGPDPMPAEYVPLMEELKTLHPGWEHRLWTEDNVPATTIRTEWRNRLRVPAERSDLLRYELLYAFGGIYLDVDFKFHKPLDPLLSLASIVVADIKEGRVNNAFIGAVPGHPIVRTLIEEAKAREFFGLDKHASGSEFVDRILSPHKGGEVAVLPIASFYLNEPNEESYATHLWARSWKDDAGWKKSATRAEEKLARAEKRAAMAEQHLLDAVERERKFARARERLIALLAERYAAGVATQDDLALLDELAGKTARSLKHAAKATLPAGAAAKKPKEEKPKKEKSAERAPIDRSGFSSAAYWEERYAAGRSSGRGAKGAIGQYKADTVNDFVKRHAIQTVIDLGCGDGVQTALLDVPSYLGIEISKTAVQLARKALGERSGFRFAETGSLAIPDAGYDLALSLGVIAHLVEDDMYQEHMSTLFRAGAKYVMIYSTNFDEDASPHVRHRNYTAWIEQNALGWRLEQAPESPPDVRSDGSFRIYARVGAR